MSLASNWGDGAAPGATITFAQYDVFFGKYAGEASTFSLFDVTVTGARVVNRLSSGVTFDDINTVRNFFAAIAMYNPAFQTTGFEIEVQFLAALEGVTDVNPNAKQDPEPGGATYINAAAVLADFATLGPSIWAAKYFPGVTADQWNTKLEAWETLATPPVPLANIAANAPAPPSPAVVGVSLGGGYFAANVTNLSPGQIVTQDGAEYTFHSATTPFATSYWFTKTN